MKDEASNNATIEPSSMELSLRCFHNVTELMYGSFKVCLMQLKRVSVAVLSPFGPGMV